MRDKSKELRGGREEVRERVAEKEECRMLDRGRRENAGDRLKLKIKADVGGRSADARRERCREEWRKRRSLSRGRAAY